MFDLLNDLPENDIRRHRPLDGAWHRTSIPVPIEVTDSIERRAEIHERQRAGERKWTPWKQVKGWKIAKCCFNDLGPVWTNDSQWTLDNPKP